MQNSNSDTSNLFLLFYATPMVLFWVGLSIGAIYFAFDVYTNGIPIRIVKVLPQNAETTRPHRKICFSATYIPGGCKIEEKQIVVKEADTLTIWDDAVPSPLDVIGKRTKRSIPLDGQFRISDLN